MGVWGGVDPRIVDPAAIAEQMRPALYEWFTGHVRIFDLNRDEDGTPTVVLDSGQRGALVQALRTPSTINAGGQPNTLIGVRFQMKRDGAVTPGQTLRPGLVVKVIDGGNDELLEAPTYSLGDVIDGTLAWGHIFEATVVTGGF